MCMYLVRTTTRFLFFLLLLYLGGPAGYLLGCGRLDLNLVMTDKVDGLWFMGAVVVWRLTSHAEGW